MASWPTVAVSTPQGVREGIAPLVVSASRATDIPAFHAAWFMDRLRAGLCEWRNPFNAAQRMLVSFESCRVIVFWTKNPRPLMPHLAEIAARGFRACFQFTLNDYAEDGLEPGIPPLGDRVDAFLELSERLGPECVVWRHDPIILGGSLTADRLLRRIDALGAILSPRTERLIFSFADWPARVARNLRRRHPDLRPSNEEEMRGFAAGLVSTAASWPCPPRLSTCAEGISLPGVDGGGCIEADLLLRLCPDDPAMIARYARRRGRAPRDSGQRGACRCAPSKDVGFYDSCPHGCAYCYANRSPAAAIAARPAGGGDPGTSAGIEKKSLPFP